MDTVSNEIRSAAMNIVTNLPLKDQIAAVLRQEIAAGPLPDMSRGQTRMDTLRQTIEIMKDVMYSDGSLTNAGKRRYTDDPTVKKSKQDFKSAKKAYIKAQRRANAISTSNSIKEADLALKKFKSAKFKYKVDKETARISEKGITFKSKSKHRQKLEDEYRKMGLDKEHAQAAANKRIRTERILAASAAMTVSACAAYYAHHKYKNKIDGIIKAGESLQRI